MNTFNRGLLAILALAWIAVLAAGIWMIWDQTRVIDISSNAVSLNFDIVANTQAERILGTIIAAALMFPALMLLLLELKPSRRRDMVVQTANESDVHKMQDRIGTLERDLAEERARNDNLRARGADTAPRHAGSRRWNLFSRNR